MGTTIKVTMDGDVAAYLRALRPRLTGPKNDLLVEFGDIVATDQRMAIEESRDIFTGGPFPPLKRVVEGKTPRGKSHNQDPRPLMDSLALLESIYAEDPRGYSIRVGPHVDYAKYQNDGTDTIPQRQFVGISRASYEAIAAMQFEFVMAAIQLEDFGIVARNR
jgi:hypothetical protein